MILLKDAKKTEGWNSKYSASSKVIAMRRTALYEIYKALEARMVEYAGFYLPVEYTGVIAEHRNVRENAGIFDVSHMGEFRASGPYAADFLQRMTTNDVSELDPGKVQYTCMPNGRGGIVDDLLICRLGDDEYWLVVNAANIDKDWKWLNENNRENADLQNLSSAISLIALQGPRSASILKEIGGPEVESIKPFNLRTLRLDGIRKVIVSATGYTGAGGFELFVENKDAVHLWNILAEAGKTRHLKPAGLAARDTLRLEMGYCLYGNDIDDSTSPIEAGLGWITKFNDRNHFIDRERLLKQKEEGVDRKLTGFVMTGRGIPRSHYDILDDQGKLIGRVTSGTLSPMMNKGIGMGYVKSRFSKKGTRINIRIRNKVLGAEITGFPIYKA